MAVTWRNTLQALNQSDAEKVLAYAKEHYQARGLVDYDEQTMGGLEFTEDSLVYTDGLIDRLDVFYKFADEIGADGYSKDAQETVALVKQLIKK